MSPSEFSSEDRSLPHTDLRAKIVRRISDSPSDTATLSRLVSEFGAVPGFYSVFLSVLCDIELSEAHARGLWNRAASHRDELEAHVRRSVDVRVSLMDLLTTEAAFLEKPRISDLGRDEQRRKDAFLDEVTGLHNRRYVQTCIEREISRSQRHGLTFSLLFLDMDEFKAINDLQGHATGDEMLRIFGTEIRDALRAEDVVARYGGDEFLVVMPRTDLDGAGEIEDRLQQTARELSTGLGIKVSFSAGVAVYPADGATVGALVQAADRRMYKCKGRDGDARPDRHDGEQRRHRRYPARHLVEMDVGSSKPICGSARDLSVGGICLETVEKVTVGQYVPLRIYCWDEQRTYHVTSRIVWVRELPGQRIYQLGASHRDQDRRIASRLVSGVRRGNEA